jgi:hypothetical protein
MQRRPSLAVRQSDTAFEHVWDAFVALIAANAFASKHDILKEANHLGLADNFPWISLVNVSRGKQPWVLILPLTKLIFVGPRAKSRQGVTPNRYISPTYKHAYGFASVAQFVQLGDLHREIAEVKYKQQEIVAARAMERVENFRGALAMPAAAPTQQHLLI